MEIYDLRNHLLEKIYRLNLAGANRLWTFRNFTHMLVSLKFQYEFHVTERLNERHDVKVMQSDCLQEFLDGNDKF